MVGSTAPGTRSDWVTIQEAIRLIASPGSSVSEHKKSQSRKGAPRIGDTNDVRQDSVTVTFFTRARMHRVLLPVGSHGEPRTRPGRPPPACAQAESLQTS